MDDNASNVVWMRFEGGDLLGGVVVVDSQLKVIRATYDPILTSDETASADRDICELEGFDNGLERSVLGLSFAESHLPVCRMTRCRHDRSIT